MKLEESYHDKGLSIICDCLNELLEESGQRKRLIKAKKEKVLKAYEDAKKYISIELINEKLKINSARITQLKTEGKCNYSPSQSCLKLYPSQLSLNEQNQIKKYLSDPLYQTWYTNHIWAEAQRNGLYVSIHSFYRYTRHLYGKRIIPVETIEPEKVSIRAERPFQIIHMDSTEFRCINFERVYVHFIMDNFSRTILGAVASHSSKSNVVAKNLKKAIFKYTLHNKSFQLYCDDGPENQGEVTELLLNQNINIEKVVANYKTKKSNNMIEAWNKRFKQVILKIFKPKSFDHLEELLPEMVEYTNNLKLPILKTLSAYEVLSGIKYENLDMKIKMEKAKQIRLEQNQCINCDVANSSENVHEKICGVKPNNKTES